MGPHCGISWFNALFTFFEFVTVQPWLSDSHDVCLDVISIVCSPEKIRKMGSPGTVKINREFVFCI